MTRSAAVLAVVVATALLLPAAHAQDRSRPAPKAAVAAALEHAVFHYADPTRIRVTHTIRSDENRAWSLVTGSYGRRGLWAAWTRRTSGGAHRVAIFRTRDFDPGERPPCDIRPAFSEPEC